MVCGFDCGFDCGVDCGVDYSASHLAAAGFALLVAINSAVIAYVTSEISLMKKAFRVSSLEANVAVLVYPVFLLFGPLVVWVTRRLGPIRVLWVASVLSIASALSAISATNYPGFLCLAILSAVPQVLLNCNYNTIARCFISPPFRASYLALLNVVKVAAYSLGFCIAVLWIQEEDQMKHDFRLFQIVPFFLASVALLLFSVLWYKTTRQTFALNRMATDRGLDITDRPRVRKRFILCWIWAAALSEGMNEAVALLLEQLFHSQDFSSQDKLIGGLLFFIPSIPVPFVPAYLINYMSLRTSLVWAPLVAIWISTLFALLVLVPMDKVGLFLVLVFYTVSQNVSPTFATAGTEQFDAPYEIDILNNMYSTGIASTTLLYTLLFALMPTYGFAVVFVVGVVLSPILLTVAEMDLMQHVQEIPL